MGLVHSSQLCQEPSNPTAGISLRAQEMSKLPEEIILQEESWIKASWLWWRLDNVCTVTSCPCPRGTGASQELCLGFLGSQDLGFGGSLLKVWHTQGCGHRKCIHTCPEQSGASEVSDVLLDRVELWDCGDVTPRCFPNKPTNLLLPGLGFHWPRSHALSLELRLAPADTGSQQGDSHLVCLWGLILVFSFPLPWCLSLSQLTLGLDDSEAVELPVPAAHQR